jgi:hypothetical protein
MGHGSDSNRTANGADGITSGLPKPANGMRRIGIVALARRLVIDLWRFVEFGTIPEGAQLKASSAI